MRLSEEKIATYHFQLLEQPDFISLEQAASLKGLLKPFKGKRALDGLTSQCEQLRNQLIVLARTHVLQQTKSYPFSLLPVQLAQQTTSAGTVFLRWRTVDRSTMGVHLWDELIWSQKTSSNLVADLYAIEVQRIVLNMQVSLMHTIARQACACAEKLAHAQSVFEKRIS